MNKEWELSELEKKIITLLLDPNHLKRGAIGKFLKDNNIEYADYHKAKANPNFNTYLAKLSDDLMKGALLEVTSSLIRGAKKGSVAQQKLYFEMMNKYVQKIELVGLAEEIKEMSDADLAKIATAGDE